MSTRPEDYTYDVVIPIYNSQAIVGETLRRTAAFFEQQGWQYRIIAVHDGSPDNSWEKVAAAARENPNIVAIDLLRNYGQHTAVYAGFHHAEADFVITMDDDLQNPPEEIPHLVNKILEGHDVVFGQFHKKEHETYRRLGSKVVQGMNHYIFGKPPELVVSNFRILSHETVEAIRSYRTAYPYINGLCLMFSRRRANVLVEHHPRKVGRSNYNLLRIFWLVLRILFNYSAAPLHFVSTLGFSVALLAFVVGVYFFLRALLLGTQVPGWASQTVLISFFSGVNIVIVSMVGEYVSRLMRQVSLTDIYHIRKKLNDDD